MSRASSCARQTISIVAVGIRAPCGAASRYTTPHVLLFLCLSSTISRMQSSPFRSALHKARAHVIRPGHECSCPVPAVCFVLRSLSPRCYTSANQAEDRVMIKATGSRSWRSATVTERGSPGRYNVLLDDGSMEEGVASSRLR